MKEAYRILKQQTSQEPVYVVQYKHTSLGFTRWKLFQEDHNGTLFEREFKTFEEAQEFVNSQVASDKFLKNYPDRTVVAIYSSEGVRQ